MNILDIEKYEVNYFYNYLLAKNIEMKQINYYWSKIDLFNIILFLNRILLDPNQIERELNLLLILMKI